MKHERLVEAAIIIACAVAAFLLVVLPNMDLACEWCRALARAVGLR